MQYSTSIQPREIIYQDAGINAHHINLFFRCIGRRARETHLDISRTSSIEESCIKVGDKNNEHRDQEARKNNGDKDERS